MTHRESHPEPNRGRAPKQASPQSVSLRPRHNLNAADSTALSTNLIRLSRVRQPAHALMHRAGELAQKPGNSYGIPMEFLWSFYGNPMEHPAGTRLSPGSHRPSNALDTRRRLPTTPPLPFGRGERRSEGSVRGLGARPEAGSGSLNLLAAPQRAGGRPQFARPACG